MAESMFRLIGAERADEWVARGHKRRHFFAHTLFHLPKCGPDGYRMAQAMWGVDDLSAHWQLLAYADPALIEQFPRAMFFDDDLIWHQQHFGRPGQVATASVAVDRAVAYSMGHQADLVQRIGRARKHRSQIEKRLRGWPWMMLNGVLAFADGRGIATVRLPGSELAMRHTDRARMVQPYLFERVYDRPVAEIPGARRCGEWWEIDVASAAAAVVAPVRSPEAMAEEKTVCVFHDLERGFGHLDTDRELAQRAERAADGSLTAMLAIEADADVPVTYNVVGRMLSEVREQIEAGGHAVAFHSFDHTAAGRQLERCRELDYRLKGYRLPRSQHTDQTSDERLAFHNFEWLASSSGSLGTTDPELRDRLVRLPVTLDDYPLYTGQWRYEEWEHRLLAHVERSSYTAVGLHDSYAHLWLDRYPELLAKLSAAATLRTFDQVSADVILGAAA